MPDEEPRIEPTQELRLQFETLVKNLNGGPNRSAAEALVGYQAALKGFELGLQLGKENTSASETLSEEIHQQLSQREQQIGEQINPARRLKG